MAGRPLKWRRVCQEPATTRFGPLGMGAGQREVVRMTVDEYETIRLIDLEGFQQFECAEQMNVARTTVQGIYGKARRKLAEALVHGKMLIIEGGEYRLCDQDARGCGPGCHYRHGRGQGMRGPRGRRRE